MIEVYIKDGCPYCKKQLEVMERRGVEYSLYNVSIDSEALTRVRNEYNADKVPVVIKDGTVKNIGFGGGG